MEEKQKEFPWKLSLLKHSRSTSENFLNYKLHTSSNTLQELMQKVYAGAYTSGELIIKIVDAELRNVKSVPDAFCVIHVNTTKEERKDTTGKDRDSPRDANNNNNNNNNGSEKPHSIVSKAFKTSVLPKESNPCWNEGFLVEISNKARTDLLIEVRAWSFIGREKVLGKHQISLKNYTDGVMNEDSFPLFSEKDLLTGSIRVQITYTSALRRNMDYMTANEHYDVLTAMLLEKEGTLVSTLFSLCKDDELSMAVIRFFNSNGGSLLLLKNLISREIEERGDPTTLFRSDSMATKTMRNYFHLISKKSYLRRRILPLIEQVTAIITTGGSFEVFPNMLQGQSLEENTHRLWTVTQSFTSSILESYDGIPRNMKKIFGAFGEVLIRKYGSLPLAPAGSLFFLRFVCPAVVFPMEYGIINEPLDPTVYRGLLLVGKVMQGMASRAAFREDALIPFNDLVTHFQGNVEEFLKLLFSDNQSPTGPVDDPRAPYTKEELVKLLSIIVRKIHIHLETIIQRLAEMPHQQDTVKKLLSLFKDVR